MLIIQKADSLGEKSKSSVDAHSVHWEPMIACTFTPQYRCSIAKIETCSGRSIQEGSSEEISANSIIVQSVQSVEVNLFLSNRIIWELFWTAETVRLGWMAGSLVLFPFASGQILVFQAIFILLGWCGTEQLLIISDTGLYLCAIYHTSGGHRIWGVSDAISATEFQSRIELKWWSDLGDLSNYLHECMKRKLRKVRRRWMWENITCKIFSGKQWSVWRGVDS